MRGAACADGLWNASLAASPARSISFEKPDVENGLPRSAGEDERACWLLFALEAAQGAQFIALNRVRGRRAFLGAADVQRRCGEIDLVPSQVNQFGGAQAVTEGHEDHRAVAQSPSDWSLRLQ